MSPVMQSIMAVPTSVSQLIALLNRQEVLRDNALLVLAKLVRGNVDAQKSAVQNGCFEQLFVILR